MKKEALFRTCVFGGYNKEDVLSYIHQLENELERLKSMEKSGGRKEEPPLEDGDMAGDDVIVFNEQMVEQPRQIREEGKREAKAAAPSPAPAVMSDKGASADEIHLLEEKLKKAGEELEQVKTRLRENERQMERSSRELEEKEWEIKKKGRELEEKEYQMEDNSRQLAVLRAECEKLKKEHDAYEEDYRAIKNVLLNARVDAGVIVAKAQERARLILEEAQKHIQLETRKSVALLVDHLRENQEGLDLSKSYLEQQLKNIDDVKQQIEEIRSNIENMSWQPGDGHEEFSWEQSRRGESDWEQSGREESDWEQPGRDKFSRGQPRQENAGCSQPRQEKSGREEKKNRKEGGPEVTIDEEFEDDFILDENISGIGGAAAGSIYADREKVSPDIRDMGKGIV